MYSCLGIRIGLERRFPRSILFYFACVVLFTVGYFAGVHQNQQWCDGRLTRFLKPNADENFQRGTIAPPVNMLLVIVFSAPPNRSRRDVIRSTWLLTKGPDQSVRHFFVISTLLLKTEQIQELMQEHNSYGDLLLLQNVRDSYTQLSLKLKEALKFVDSRYNFTFLLKVDDDSFARLDEIYYRLALLPTQRFYWGFFDGQAHVKSKGKWKENKWFLCDRYLPYAKGGGYVISKDLVHQLVLVSDYLTLYQNEDVALGTWLAPFDIQRRHDPLFDTEYLSRGCHNDYVVTHKQTEAMMIEKYKSILKSGDLCATEKKVRNSYIYNWNVLPSQCCKRNDSTIP